MSENLKILLDYLERKGVSYTIDTNPSKEKIDRILKSRERHERTKADLLRAYESKNLGQGF